MPHGNGKAELGELETLLQWFERQGGRANFVPLAIDGKGSTLIGPTGATISGLGQEVHVRQEPPQDELRRLMAERLYLRRRLERIDRDLRRVRGYIETQSQYHRSGVGPAPSEDAFTDLQALVDEKAEYDEALRRKEAEIEALGPTPAQVNDQRRARQRQQADAALERMARILSSHR